MITLAREAGRDWMADAACRNHDPEMWFPTAGLPTAYALAICRGCPVKKRCEDYADSYGERHGVWGGKQRGLKARRKAGEP